MGITNSQYDAIMRVYEKRRNDNHHVEEEHRRTAYEAIPELSRLDEAVASLSARAVRDSLLADQGQNKNVSPSVFNDLLAQAGGGMSPDKRRRELLKKHSFPSDYLDPVYTCRECRDTGWIGRRHCHCFDREVVSLFYTQSGLSDVLQKENFDTFNLNYYRSDLIDERTGHTSREIMAAARNTCRRFASDYGSGSQKDYLLISGAAGLGKTFLTHCIAKDLIDKGHSVIYYSAGELFDLLAKSKFQKGDDFTDIDFDDEYLTGCDLLIIDDLGTELTNSFVGTALFQLLNMRTARGKGMVISTNLSLQDIGRIYSDRISSRVTEHFTLVRAFGEDIRVRKRIGQI